MAVVISVGLLSPPQRLLLVNTSERKTEESGSAGERKQERLRAFLPSPTVGGLCGGERLVYGKSINYKVKQTSV